MKRFVLFVLLIGTGVCSLAQNAPVSLMPASSYERTAVLDEIDFRDGKVVIGGQHYRLSHNVRLHGVKDGEGQLKLAQELRNSRVAYSLAGSEDGPTVTGIWLLPEEVGR